MITALIDHKKILVALVNGPAIGVACTMLSLFDYTVVSDKAYFLCPFTVIGLLPEGTSSHNFAAIMGYPRAAKLALFGDRITAKEAFEAGYISKVVPDSQFATETQKIMKDFETRLAPQVNLKLFIANNVKILVTLDFKGTHERTRMEREDAPS